MKDKQNDAVDYVKTQHTVFVDVVMGFNVSSYLDGNVLYVLVVGEPESCDDFMLEFIGRNLDQADVYHVRYLDIDESFLHSEIEMYFEVSREQLYEHIDDLIGHYKLIYTADVNALLEDIPEAIQFLHPSGKLKNLYERVITNARQKS